MSTTAVEIPGYVAGTYTIDPGHSDVAFAVRHLMVSKVRGPYGSTRAGFSATTELNRGDFGISTNIPMDGGGVVIGDRMQVFLEIEAVLNPPQPTT